MGDVARRGPRGRPLRAHLQDPPRPDRRDRRRRPRDGAVRRSAEPAGAAARGRAVAAGAGALHGRPRRARRARHRARAARARRRAASALTPPDGRVRRRARGGRGRRRDRVGGAQPGARHAAQRRDRAPPPRSGSCASDLDDFKRVKDALGGTVNDVVLAVVAGALRRWLHSRGTRTEGLELRGLVPVSIRSEGERGDLGNRIAAMRGPLPVYIADPVARLRFVRQAMDGLKESKQARRRRGDRRRAATSPRRRSSPRRRGSTSPPGCST